MLRVAQMFRRHSFWKTSLTLSAALFLIVSIANAVIVERIVAIIGDKPILLSDLRERARPFLIQIARTVPPGAPRAAQESQMYKELLDKIIDEELLQQSADKSHIRVTSTEIDNALHNVAAAQKTTIENLFKLAKETSGLNEQDYRDEIARQILEGKMLELRVKGKIRITEEDIKNMYAKVVREERNELEYQPAWIVLRVPTNLTKEKVMVLANSIYERAKQGEDFSKLAAEYSDDSATKEIGGDLGTRVPQKSRAAIAGRLPVMNEELEEVLRNMEPGQIAPPTDYADAVVILKLTSRAASHFPSVDASRRQLLQMLQTDILMNARRKWLDQLRKQIHVETRL